MLTRGKMLPVQTGYLWALQYVLINDFDDSPQLAKELAYKTEDIIENLFIWDSSKLHLGSQNLVAYALKHQYEPEDLSLSSLEGQDHRRVRFLADCVASLEDRFYLFLAQFGLYETFTNDASREGWKGRYLSNVSTLDGCKLSPLNVPVHKSVLLNRIVYGGRKPDTISGGHGSIKQSYFNTVSVPNSQHEQLRC